MYTVSSIPGIILTHTGRFSKSFHWYNLLKICNKVVTKYPTSRQTCRYTTTWNINVRKTAACALWQSCWKMSSLGSWRVAGSKFDFKSNLFISTSFTNLLCEFSILFVIISRQFFANSNNLIKKAFERAFTKEDRSFIKILFLIIGYGLWRVMTEFTG